MQSQITSGGVVVADAVLGVHLGPALPTLSMTVGGNRHDWRATSLVDATHGWLARVGDTGVTVELTANPTPDGMAVGARIVNHSGTDVTLHRSSVIATEQFGLGGTRADWRIYRHSYQSWAGTWTIGVGEHDRDVPTRFGRLGVTDGRHRAARHRGHVRSDSLSVIAGDGSGALGAGFTTLADAFGFIEIDAPSGRVRGFDVWVDLDDTVLAAGAATPWYEVRIVIAADGTTALRSLIAAAGAAAGARGVDRPHPTGWCSWYYYFTKVTEADVLANLRVLESDGRGGPRFGCEYVMVDDGHQTAIGDWLSTNDKFPRGMAAVAADIGAAGFDAGIWWAPFIVSSRSRIAAEHPEWLVRNRRGKPVLGLFNPGWGLHPMWVLDTTHPDALAHITEVARVISRDWGYAIQKIDFLFAASHPGVRHDPTATRAQALRRGLDAVRAGAGDDAFVLGCGSPLGPAVGVVDAMRIGADVTPSWTTTLARTVGRNRHALSTANALLNTMTRSAFDGVWFLNDPDCLMVRDTDTKLTEAEVHTMCTVFGLTDGMVVVSDRLDLLPPERQDLVARTLALTGGEVTVVDLFDRALPRVLVARHADRVDIAVVNLGDRPCSGRVDLAAAGIDDTWASSELREHWTGRAVSSGPGHVDVGEVAPHGCGLVQLRRR